MVVISVRNAFCDESSRLDDGSLDRTQIHAQQLQSDPFCGTEFRKNAGRTVISIYFIFF